MIVIEIRDVNGTVLATFSAEARTFKTGSRGFHASGKAVINGKKHQVGCNVIEVGSKPGATE
jgi:hypothetical protein